MLLKKLLIIAQNWPAPNYSAAGVRLLQLINFFKSENYKITIASAAENKESFYEENIETIKILLNHDSFNEFVKKLQPNVVLFDRFISEEQFGWRVSENIPNALKILDTEDLHSLRKSREKALKSNLVWSPEFWRTQEITKREVASVLRCDLSLIISDFEVQLLVDIIPNIKEQLLHLPFMVQSSSLNKITSIADYENRKDFVFIGFGGHSPNVDAILHLKQEIWPLIRNRLPDINLHIYGGHLPQKVTDLHSKKHGFIVKGWVKDAHQVISNARVLLAPLRFGAGQKGKLLDAMLCGTPSITTTIGAEGMHNELPWNGEVQDNPQDFSEAAVRTYCNFESWQVYQKNGHQILHEIFEKEMLSRRFRLKLMHIQKHLSVHRSKNFIGNLIQHQSMMGTKYMSKWIEIKNLNNK
ncbi:glycosyltransferase [Kriegella sp. EG-1]|nr:glycosyltransferase [Flavobacteriaceae bacterium EG-1]